MGKIITMEVKPSYGLSDKKLKKKIRKMPITPEMKKNKGKYIKLMPFLEPLTKGYKKQ
tara:strand:- start:166 stop:339 length:174 start_codon:yes stop_codon:yes gene_type:complete